VVPTFNSQILMYHDVSLSQSVKSAKSGYQWEWGHVVSAVGAFLAFLALAWLAVTKKEK